MLSLQDITLTYADGDRRLTALDHVSLSPAPGTLTGITGPSGSGKSSLLAVAATLILPDSGRVLLDGVDTATLSAAERTRLRREKLGVVFQQANLLPSLTARDQVRAVVQLAGSRAQRRAADARADELLERVGLAAQAHLRPHQLSGGQRQRVNIARALVADPRVLLVDEPTSALDTAAGAAVIDLIAELTRDTGATTLLVTHDLQHERRFDDLVTLVDGRVTERRADLSAVPAV